MAALQSGSHSQTDPVNIAIWAELRFLGSRGWLFHVQFVFSHCDMPRNDAADAAAGDACNLPLSQHEAAPLDRNSALTRLKRVLWRDWADNCHTNNLQYEEWLGGRRAPRLLGLSRRGEMDVRRLRTGHHALLRVYASREARLSASQEERVSGVRNCLLCKQPASLRHFFFDCAGGRTLEARLSIIAREAALWSESPGVILRTLLFQKPHLALEYLQQAGFLDGYRIYP